MPASTASLRARLNADELHQLRWLLGLVLALLANWTLFDLDIGQAGLALISAATVIISLCLVFPGLPGRIPAWAWRLSAPALLVFIVGDLLLSRGDVLPALVRTVAVLTFYRCLQYRRRREDMQLALLCLFITVLSGVLTLSLLFGLQILLFSIAAMTQLFVVNLLARQRERELTAADWRHFRWPHLLRRLVHAADVRLLALWGVLFAIMVAVSTVIFILMPRFRFDQNIAFSRLKGTAGFSESIDYNIQFVENDDTVALRVDAPTGVTITTSPYWRMAVFDRYRDNGFSPSGNAPGFPRTVTYVPPGRYDRPEGVLPGTGQWKFYLEGNTSKYLPILGPFDRITLSSAQYFQDQPEPQVYRLRDTLSSVFGYQIDNMDLGDRIGAGSREINMLTGLGPLVPTGGRKAIYPETTLELPPRAEDRELLKKIVAEIRGGEDGATPPRPLDFAPRAISYLHRHHPPARERAPDQGDDQRDVLFRWLDSNSPGWCEHFAGSFVLLARTAGLPARVVVGYRGASYNEIEEYYVVRQSNAHAWAEVFDAATRCWLRVDPTPGAANPFAGAPTSDLAEPVRAETGWSARLDSLRMLWYRRVINFDQTDQQEMAKNLAVYFKVFLESLRAQAAKYWALVLEWIQQPLRGAHLRQLAGLGLAAFLLYLARHSLQNLWLRLAARGWLARLQRTSPVRRRAGGWLRRFAPAWRARAPVLPPAERAAWDAVRHDLLALRYGSLEAPPDPVATFARARRLLRSAR